MIFLLWKHRNTRVTLLFMVKEFRYLAFCWLSAIICQKQTIIQKHETQERVWQSLITKVTLKFTGKQCMVDSGGYTMKWRSVKPNPWEVRRKSTVLGLGHENSSSAGYPAAGESAMPLQSGDSFCARWKKWKKELKLRSLTFTFTMKTRSDGYLLKNVAI